MSDKQMGIVATLDIDSVLQGLQSLIDYFGQIPDSLNTQINVDGLQEIESSAQGLETDFQAVGEAAAMAGVDISTIDTSGLQEVSSSAQEATISMEGMGGASGDVSLNLTNIGAAASHANSGFTSLNSTVGETAGKTSEAASSAEGMAGAFGNVQSIVGALVGIGLGAWLTDSIQKARDSADSWNKLGVILNQHGVKLADVKSEITDVAYQQGFMTSGVRETIRYLMQAGMSYDDVMGSQGALNAAMGISVALNQDLDSSARGLQRAYMGQGRQLKLLGIDVKDYMDKSTGMVNKEALNAAILEKTGGLLREHANSYEAMSVRLDIATSKFQVALGQTMLPVINPIIEGITSMLMGFDKLDPSIKSVTLGAVAFGGTIAALSLTLAAVSNIIGFNMVAAIGKWVAAQRAAQGSTWGLVTANAALLISVGVLAAAFVALYLVMDHYGDNVGKFNEADQKSQQYISGLKNRIKELNTEIGNLNTKRTQEIAKGHDVSDIDAQIASKKRDLTTVTKDLDSAESTYATNKAARAALDQQWVQNEQTGAERSLEMKKKLGIISEQEYQKQKSDLAGMGALNQDYAHTLEAVQGWRDRELGTIEKLRTSNSDYAKEFQKNPEMFKEYASQYDSMVNHMTKANEDLAKGDYLGFIVEGLQGMLAHLNVWLIEGRARIWAWWDSWSISESIEDHITKPFMDWFNSWSLAGLFQQYITGPIMAWWNSWTLMDLGEKLQIPSGTLSALQTIYGALRSIYCMIVGCSPGVIPAFNQLVATIASVPGMVAGFFSSLISTVVTWATTWINYARQAGSGIVTNVISFLVTLPGRAWAYLLSTANRIIAFGTVAYSMARNAAIRILTGIRSGMVGIPGMVYNELLKVGGKIASVANTLYQQALKVGRDIYQGIKTALHISSPGIIYWMISDELDRINNLMIATQGTFGKTASLLGEGIVSGFAFDEFSLPTLSSLPDIPTFARMPSTNQTTLEININKDAVVIQGNATPETIENAGVKLGEGIVKSIDSQLGREALILSKNGYVIR